MTPANDLDRNLNLEGCFNARDLGGLRTLDGRRTRFGIFARSDALDHLSLNGWEALQRHGIRTIIDLRGEVERTASVAAPDGITVCHAPIEDLGDSAFWERSIDLMDTPAYFEASLARWPEAHAAVIRTVAHAEPDRILIHCGVGRDRTGLIALLLLKVAGVRHEEFVADYLLSHTGLKHSTNHLGTPRSSAKTQPVFNRESSNWVPPCRVEPAPMVG